MQKKLTLHSGADSLAGLGVVRRKFSLAPRYDIAPGHLLGAVVTEGEERVFRGFRWGMVPAWWDAQRRERQRLFSARAETLAERPAFASALRGHRAVVPVDGFWMWREVQGERLPFYLRARAGGPLYLAALWEEGDGEDRNGEDRNGENEDRLAIVTVPANRLVEPLGKRMPAILRGDAVSLWLDTALTESRALTRALQTPPSRFLTLTPTDPWMNGRAGLEAYERERDILALVYGQQFRIEKPRFSARKRLVRRDHETSGQVFFRTHSFTREDATKWHPVVDIEEGHVFCDCPDFRYRHAHHEPDIWTPHWWCKHVERAVANCKRHGELPVRG